jgi:cytochrome c biogenesis protein ResB
VIWWLVFVGLLVVAPVLDVLVMPHLTDWQRVRHELDDGTMMAVAYRGQRNRNAALDKLRRKVLAEEIRRLERDVGMGP